MTPMRLLQYISLAILCGTLPACTKWGNSENSRLMQQAQSLVEQMPDSALSVLDAINTASFSNAGKAEYTLQRVQAKDNAEMDITSDTEILPVREYFLKGKKRKKRRWPVSMPQRWCLATGRPTGQLCTFRKRPILPKTQAIKFCRDVRCTTWAIYATIRSCIPTP